METYNMQYLCKLDFCVLVSLVLITLPQMLYRYRRKQANGLGALLQMSVSHSYHYHGIATIHIINGTNEVETNSLLMLVCAWVCFCVIWGYRTVKDTVSIALKRFIYAIDEHFRCQRDSFFHFIFRVFVFISFRFDFCLSEVILIKLKSANTVIFLSIL